MNTQQISLEQENVFNAGVRGNQITRLVRRGTVSLAALIVFALEFAPASAFAATYYVDSVAGNDTNAGSTPNRSSAPIPMTPRSTTRSAALRLAPGSRFTNHKVT